MGADSIVTYVGKNTKKMNAADNILELVGRATSLAGELNPTDTAEIEALQAIFNQIEQSIEQVASLCPAQLLAQVKGTTSDVDTALKKILQNQLDDTNQAIVEVGGAISKLRSLIDEISQQSQESPSQTAETVSSSEEADMTQEPQCPAENQTQVEVDVKSEPQSEPESQAKTEPQEATILHEDDIPLLLDFVAESNEHIESSEAGLLELEERPGDNEVLNQIFRAFHTIKGMAGFLNLTEIGSLAHSAENLLDMARKGDLVLAGANTDIVFESIDMIKKMVTGLAESIEQGQPLLPQKALPQLLQKLKAAAEGRIQAPPPQPEKPPTKEEDQEIDEILDAKQKTDTSGSPVQATIKAKILSTDEKIKVSTTRLDNLINMAGELVIAQLMVAEQVNATMIGEHELIRKIAHQSKIVRELQELSMAMRMVPIHGVFQKMSRLVRDLAHKFDKKISFSTSGEETELDRSIVDKIADPLVHMVRNSLDHGIESAEERVKGGKDPVGKVELRAFHQAGNIVIEIQDDGKGLDKERILKKAVENELVSANQELSDEEIFKLIFHAGLSTAKEITSVSGRGVGMDVVRKNIEALRGRIEVASTPGKGSTFTIRMPLTLAIIDGQIVKIGNQRYIIPINSIVQSLKPTRDDISSVHRRAEMLNIRGKLIPLVRLYKLFGITPVTEDPTEALTVIVEEDDKCCGLLVDELLGQQQVVIKNLGQGLGTVKGVSGGAIMGDGLISLILDVPGLIDLSRG